MFKLSLLFVVSLLASSQAFSASWGKNKQWKDGRAEVAVYDSERVVYGTVRKFREQIIVVKEDLRADTLVKADNLKAQKTIPVFKMNMIQKFDTENYPYSYMGSFFVKMKDLSDLIKVSVGSQEWCGNTFKLFKKDPQSGKATLEWNSYFDGEADQTLDLDWQKKDYFRDQLPLSLRALDFEEGYEEEIRLYDSLVSSRGKMAPPVKAVVLVEKEESVATRAGFLPAWKVTVKSPSGTDSYWFEKKYPHILVQMERSDGQKRRLYARTRWSYWDRRIPAPKILR